MSSSSFFASNCCSGSTLCPNPGWVIVADVLDAPPSPYDPGALYLVSETPTSDTEFEGHAGEYTWFSSAAQQWEFCDAVLGDKVTVENDDSCTIWCYGLSGWSEIDLGGLSYSGVNLDVGAGTFPVFSQVTAGGQFQFFPLEAGSNIVLSYNGNRLRISANTSGGGGSGETNTASNLANNPASEIFGLFKQKTGVVLDFYALELGDNIEGTLYSDRLRLDVVIPTIPPATVLQNIGTGTIPVFKGMASNVAQMYKFEVSTENSDVFNLALDAANNKLDINFTPSAGLVSMFSDMLFLYLLSGEPPNEDDQIAYFPGLGWVATPRTPSTAGSGELIIDPLPAASFGVDHYKGLLAGDRMTVATVGNDIVFTADDMNNDGSNEGGGDAEIYIGLSSGTLQFRTISGLSGITVAENGSVIEITNDGVVTITNVGAGVKLYDDVTGIVAGDASLRTLVSPDSSVDITLNGDEVELTIPDWSSLLANIGTGDGWVKTGPPWEIKSIIAQNGVSATANANDITIEGDYTVQNDGGGVGVLKDALNGIIKGYTLVAGAGMSISRVGDLITFTNTGGGGSPSSACVSAHYGLSANQTLANAGYVSDFFVVDIDTANLSDPDVVDTGGGVFEFQSTARRFVQAQVTLYPGAGQERLKVKIQFKPSGGSWGDLETLSYGYSPNNALDQQSVITLPVPIDGESGDQFRVVAGTEGSSVDAEIDYEATRMVVWTCGSGVGGSSGDVSGPGTSTDGYIPLWSGTDGDALSTGLATSEGGNESSDGGKVVLFKTSGQIHGSCGLVAGIYGTSSGAGAGVLGESTVGPGGKFVGNSTDGALLVEQETTAEYIASFQNTADGTTLIIEANGTLSWSSAAGAAGTTANLSVMVGDSGAGGTKGLVPAPSAGDAAANKYLKASGNFEALSFSGMVDQIDFEIPEPEDGTVILRLNARYRFEINSLYIKTTSGTITAKITIDGVDVTDLTGIAVSSTEASATASANFSVNTGQTVSLVLSSNSSAENLSGSLQITR